MQHDVSRRRLPHSPYKSAESGRVCVADWDGTFRHGFLTAAWVDYLVARGLFPSASQAALRHTLASYEAGSLSYATLVTDTASIYANGLKGVLSSSLQQVAQEFVGDDRHQLFPFVPVLLRFLCKRGVTTHIVSGSPEEPLRAYARLLPLSSIAGLTLAVDTRGRHTGTVTCNHGLAHSKAAAVRRLKDSRAQVVLAIGNSIADMPLFEAAAFRVWINGSSVSPTAFRERLLVFNPTSSVRELLRAISPELER